MAAEVIDKTLGSAIIEIPEGAEIRSPPLSLANVKCVFLDWASAPPPLCPSCFAIPSRTLAVVVRTSQRAQGGPNDAHAPEF